MLKPITKVFNMFGNPATLSFAWVGAEQAKAIILNDFCWSSRLISWHDLLLLLEGEHVHLLIPKTHFIQNILLSADKPIFATSSDEIKSVKKELLLNKKLK